MYFNFKDVNAEAKVISCKVSSISCGDDNVKSTKTRQDYNYAQGKITHVSNKWQIVFYEFTFNVPSSIPFSIILLRMFVVFLAFRHCQLSGMFKFIWQLLTLGLVFIFLGFCWIKLSIYSYRLGCWALVRCFRQIYLLRGDDFPNSCLGGDLTYILCYEQYLRGFLESKKKKIYVYNLRLRITDIFGCPALFSSHLSFVFHRMCKSGVCLHGNYHCIIL